MDFSDKRHSTDHTCYIALKCSFNDLKGKENALYFAFVIITDSARGSLETPSPPRASDCLDSPRGARCVSAGRRHSSWLVRNKKRPQIPGMLKGARHFAGHTGTAPVPGGLRKYWQE